jgi:hypothetical protein
MDEYRTAHSDADRALRALQASLRDIEDRPVAAKIVDFSRRAIGALVDQDTATMHLVQEEFEAYARRVTREHQRSPLGAALDGEGMGP